MGVAANNSLALQAIGRRTIRLINLLVNTAVLIVMLLLLGFCCYAIWDSNQIYDAADKSHYAIYKPTTQNEGLSFKELQAINPEVCAWLSVYGTNIDYPVTRGQDNTKYVNTNAEGNYALSGAIFLDYNNSKDFSDFNSILYGHHMQKNIMFGEIGSFSNQYFFDSHRYGNLYFNEKDHGIEFFAFIHTSAYDGTVFMPDIKGNDRKAYLDALLANANLKRDIGVTIEDNIMLLTTCSSASTNGRDVLVGRVTDEVYRNTYLNTETNDGNKSVNTDGVVKEIVFGNIILAVLLPVLILVIYYRRKNSGKRFMDNESTENEK